MKLIETNLVILVFVDSIENMFSQFGFHFYLKLVNNKLFKFVNGNRLIVVSVEFSKQSLYINVFAVQILETMLFY